jgi:hypothetical protein
MGSLSRLLVAEGWQRKQRMSPSQFPFPAVVALLLAGCRSGADDAPPKATAAEDARPKPTAAPLPRIGLAVVDSERVWCAEFLTDSAAPALESGQRVTIVFAGSAPAPTPRARVAGPHPGQCPAAFPQPRWIDYLAYRLELIDTPAADSSDTPIVGLVIASEGPWARGPDGVMRADLDGDGILEEARRCTADEGEHFTVWSARSGGGRVRRWHEYYDWGGLTDPTCQPGEDGGEPSLVETN